MEELIIRKATYFDIDTIVNIYKSQINEIKAFKRFFLDLYRKPRFHTYIIVRAKDIIGFYTVEIINGYRPRHYAPRVKTVWVHIIAVTEHNHGYGHRLMDHIESIGNDMDGVTGIGLHSVMSAYPFY